MEGKTHYRFAPIFTLGTSYLLINSGTITIESIPIALAVAIPTLISPLTSLSADADLHSYKPKYVILDQKPKLKKDGYYIVKKKVTTKDKFGNISSEIKTSKYKSPKSPQIKAWAMLFKTMGVTAHRDWRSHSPLLWGFIWFNMIYWVDKSRLSDISPTLSTLLTLIILGLGMGYMSHIVGDMFTKGGVPFGPTIKIFNKKIGGKSLGFIKILPKPLQKFFTAGNQLYNKLFLIAGMQIIGLLIIPEQTKAFNAIIIGIVRGVFVVLFNIARELF